SAPAPPEIQLQPPRDTLGTLAPTQTGPSFTNRLQNIELSQPTAPNPADYHTSTARKFLGTLASIPAGILGGVPAAEQTYSDVSNPALHKAEQQYGYDEGQYKQNLGTLQNEADFANKQQEAADKSALTQAQIAAQTGSANQRNAAASTAASAPQQKKEAAISSELAKLGYTVQFGDDGEISGVQAIPGFTPATGKPDAYHEWLASHPNGAYDDFLKDTQNAKGAGHPSGMSIYGLARMMQMAYDTDPRLVPLIPSLINQAGIQTPAGFSLQGPAAGQPHDDQGQPIGLRMPESPTTATRARGQFAESGVTDQIPG